jgi:hypothetical protein
MEYARKLIWNMLSAAERKTHNTFSTALILVKVPNGPKTSRTFTNGSTYDHHSQLLETPFAPT